MTFSQPVVTNTYQSLLPKGESSDQKSEVRRHFTLAQGFAQRCNSGSETLCLLGFCEMKCGIWCSFGAVLVPAPRTAKIGYRRWEIQNGRRAGLPSAFSP